MDYDGRRPRYEDFGDRPPLSADDVALICEALEDGGKSEDSEAIVNIWYNSARESREEAIRQYLDRLWSGLN